MTITFSLDIFRKHIGALGIRIDIDQAAVSAAQPTVDRTIKGISRRWVRHMAS